MMIEDFGLKKFCECNCGTEIKPINRFARGHNTFEVRTRIARVNNENRSKGIFKPKPIPNHHPCECGCGDLVASDRKFISGHNAKKPKDPPTYHECLCGCKTLILLTKRFVNGGHSMHAQRKLPPLIEEYHPCECGCGELISPYNRFVVGHNSKGVKQTEESIRKCAEKRIGIPSWNKGLTKETDPRMKQLSESLLGNVPWNLGLTKETDARVAKYVEASSFPRTDGARNNMSLAQKANWQDPKFAEYIISVRRASGGYEKQAKTMKKKWTDPTWRENQIIAIGNGLARKPNRPESYLQIKFFLWHPDISYCGDYSVIINGKNPDFISEERKKIIEFNGSYWHQNDIPGEREWIFAEVGYDTLILVDEDLKDEETLKMKVGTFMERPNPYTENIKCA